MSNDNDTPRVDRFSILKVLGRGGMGIVYLARDEKLGRQIALKVLSEGDLTPARRTLFLREARAAAAIRHPNVATMYEVGETGDGLPYIAMEYCQGETLARMMKSGPLDEASFLGIATQIAEGIAAAHRNGVLHRDIKSANIMVEPGGVVKILDFGLAKVLEQGSSSRPDTPGDSTTGNLFGTIHYLSPEQARGTSADARSDLFSVGVVLYEMATGKLPFTGESPLEALEKIRSGEPEAFEPLDPQLSSAVAPIIGKLLQKDPALRYQDAAALARDLGRLQRESSLDTSIAPTLPRSTLGSTLPRSRLARRRTLLLGTLLGVTIVAAAIWTRYPRTPVAPAPGNPLPIRAMAVLPLRNLSQSGQDEFLSIGLADALVTRLQQIPALQVRPTSAILPFQGKTIDMQQVSEKLQVEGLLEGYFLADGTRIRVNLQLIDTRTGYGVWAGSIDGRRDNLMQFMDEVSTTTTAALNQKLGVQQAGAASEPRTANPEAFEDYLKARALAGSLRPQDHAEQIQLLENAVRLDPKFSAAYADLSIALSLGGLRGFVANDATRRKAEWYARQAVRHDPNLPQAHLALGRSLVRFPDRFRESVRESLAALRLAPSETQALLTMASYLISAGELQRASCIIDRLVRLDPSSNDVKTRGYWNVNAVDSEGTIVAARYALASKETELAGYDMLAIGHLFLGHRAEAEEARRKTSELVPTHYIPRSLAAMIAGSDGSRAELDRLAAALDEDARNNHYAAVRLALSYAKAGDNARAILWIKRAIARGNHGWYFLVKHPWLQPLQGDPEFQAEIGKVKADLDDVRDDVIGVYELICREGTRP